MQDEIIFREMFLARFEELSVHMGDETTLGMLAEAASEIAVTLIEENNTGVADARERFALQLRSEGFALRKIGRVLGIDHPQKVAHLLQMAEKHLAGVSGPTRDIPEPTEVRSDNGSDVKETQ